MTSSERGAADPVSASSPIMTRILLKTGGASALARSDAPHANLLSDPDRKSSLSTFLRSRPDGDLWVFGYGSLIWNPALNSIDSRIAHVKGWHRSFCLSMIAGRGTFDRPGLALGLAEGGTCAGVAYRIDERAIESELELLWSREMLLGGYLPRWTDVRGADGRRFGSAITFVIDREHQHYAGGLSADELVHRLATAAGSWGSSSEYLFQTVKALRAWGIRDPELENIARLVDVAIGKARERHCVKTGETFGTRYSPARNLGGERALLASRANVSLSADHGGAIMSDIRIGGLTLEFLQDKNGTEGSLDLFRMIVQPSAKVPAPHYHRDWDETIYGLAGQLIFRIDGEDVTITPGTSAFIARGVVHSFRNDGSAEATVLSVLTPGVLGPGYFEELAELVKGGPPEPAKLKAIMDRYGLIAVTG